ncbi:hypothetical protein [Streptomyces incanus]|uniref:Uncharacterized protein n=1 Tax=Streptomyces incanus TaxID=887453 RepID=A0ABW0XWM3_9ACTN
MRHPRGSRTGAGRTARTANQGRVHAPVQDFKFVVIEQLMRIDEKLTPQFGLADLLREKGLGNDPWE